MKTCTKCGVSQDLASFYQHTSIKAPDNRRTVCKICRNAYRNSYDKLHGKIQYQSKEHINKRARQYRANNTEKFKGYSLKKSFGISVEEFKRLLSENEGKCHICNLPETSKLKSRKTRSLAVDHDHKTGKVRGLLCWACNSGIGKLKDDPEILRIAALYLEKHKKAG
jgi:hypothetical protein